MDGTIRVWDIYCLFISISPIRNVQETFSLFNSNTTKRARSGHVSLRMRRTYPSVWLETGAFIRDIQTEKVIKDLQFVGGHRIAIVHYDRILICDVKTVTREKLIEINDYSLNMMLGFFLKLS